MLDGEENHEGSAGVHTVVAPPRHDPRDDVSYARGGSASFGGGDATMADGVRTFVRKYGWRAYALPVLLLVTVLALATAGNSASSATTKTPPATTGHTSPAASTPPVAKGTINLKRDRPGSNSDAKVLAGAALPQGPSFTRKGTGSFRVLKGTSPVVGSGPLYTYDIEVEGGITGINLAHYASMVQRVLSDKRSWSGHGISLQRVDTGTPSFRVSLTSSLTVRKLCGYTIPVETSCYAAANAVPGLDFNRVVFNDARWVRGATAYVGDLNAYREYMINHEDGHALGHEHAHACLPGGLAPTMMQQTFGLKSAVTGQQCQANPWPYPPGVKGAPGLEAPDTPQNSEYTGGSD